MTPFIVGAALVIGFLIGVGVLMWLIDAIIKDFVKGLFK